MVGSIPFRWRSVWAAQHTTPPWRSVRRDVIVRSSASGAMGDVTAAASTVQIERIKYLRMGILSFVSGFD